MKKAICIVIISLMLAPAAFSSVTFTRTDGGSNLVELSYSKLNDESELRREWKTAHNSLLPADIVGTTGATVVYQAKTTYTSSGYLYSTSINLQCNEDVSAVEVIILVFDIWGQLQSKLSSTEVKEFKKDEIYTLKPRWTCSSEHKAIEALSSLAYVYQVRTKSGKIFTADLEAIAIEAQKYANELTPDAIKNFN
jgi:hypothetical protein